MATDHGDTLHANMILFLPGLAGPRRNYPA